MFKYYIQRTIRFLTHDQARLVELLSAFNLIAWAWVLLQQPEILSRDSYQTFQSIPSTAWVTVFAGAAFLQLVGAFGTHRMIGEVRFVAMALAAGCWATITVNFVVASVSTTAPANYGLLTIATAIAGGFLGWKATSTHS